MKQYDSTALEQAFQAHISFRGGTEEGEEDVLILEEEKVLL